MDCQWVRCTSVSQRIFDYGSLGQFDVVIFRLVKGEWNIGFDKTRKQIMIVLMLIIFVAEFPQSTDSRYVRLTPKTE